MWRVLSAAIFALLVVGLTSCSETKSPDTTSSHAPAAAEDGAGTASQATAAVGQTPQAAVAEFLEAVRSGDDERARAVLSQKAQEETARHGEGPTPAASDTAQFEVGEVEYRGEDGAWVACTWTDLDEQGQPMTERPLWIVRREASGWRIAGVAMEIFEGEPPLVLNFEDAAEIEQKQRWLQAEIRRRMQEAIREARGPENLENPSRR